MKEIDFLTNHIVVDIPKKPKKLTATRFAAILGLNPWKSPFATWCEITRTYEEPFEDSIYTLAGKAIEPKIINYLKEKYFLDIKSPSEIYGKDYFKKTFGDFYPDTKIFGGMWDAKSDDLIVEIKTTKRAEDWQEETPTYYKLQAALYAYLSKIDTVYMVCSFLQDSDYQAPEKFEPTVENTIVRPFKMSEDFPDFEEKYIAPALKFWNVYVETGISPDFDEQKDKDVLKELRKTVVQGDSDFQAKIKDVELLLAEKEKYEAILKPIDTELKQLLESIKTYQKGNFIDGKKQIETRGENYVFTLTKSVRAGIDTDLLKADNLFDKYKKVSETYVLKTKKI